MLEKLLYEKTAGKRMLLFLENVKMIASQRDTMFSAIEFPADHPIEKSVRAILAATIKHLDLGMLIAVTTMPANNPWYTLPIS